MTINYREEMELADQECQLDPDCELAAAYGQIAKLTADNKELELNLQVFEKQWLLYKQKSDLAVEEILKLRQQVTKLETALEWYTEKGNMDRYIATSEHHTHDGEHWFNCWMMSPVTDVARKALGRKTETEELLNGRKGIHS